MATFHLSVKVGKVGAGGPHSDYITRSGRYAAKSQDDLEHTESGNLPDWAAGDPRAFWEASDLYERKNGSAYREFEVALPRELDPEQRLALVREFIEAELPNHTYTFAIHNPKAAIDGGEQPHAHIMYSERIQDGIQRTAETHFKRANKKSPELGGCAKSDRFSGGKVYAQRKEAITALRANWANLQNKHLEKFGHEARVDHRSLKDQGIDPAERVPESKLGPNFAAVYGKELAAQRRGAASKAPEWKAYIAERKSHFSEKTADKLAQQKRFEQERKELYARQKARRDELKGGDWKNKREVLNTTRSLIAAEQAAEKAALREKHQQEREVHRQKFQPFPVFEQWQQAQKVEVQAEPQRIEGDRTEPPTPRDIRAYVPEVIGQQVNYSRRDGGVVRGAAFVDKGKTIDIHDWRDSDTTLAALQLAAQKFGTINVNGNDEYKAMVATLAAEHGFKIANPEMQEAIQQERARIQQDRQQARKAAQDAAKQTTPVEPAEVAVDESVLRKEAEEWHLSWIQKSPQEQAAVQRDLETIGQPMPKPTLEENIRAFEGHLKARDIREENHQIYARRGTEIFCKVYDDKGQEFVTELKPILRGESNAGDSTVQQRALAEEKKKMWIVRDDDKVEKLALAIEAKRANQARLAVIREEYAKFQKEHSEKLKAASEKKQEELKKLAEKLKRIGPMVETIKAERRAQRETRQQAKPRTPKKERGMER